MSMPKVISPEIVVKILIYHLGISVACLILFALIGRLGSIRAYIAAAGSLAALIASGEGVWMSIRLRNVRCSLLTVCALVALAFWAWLVFLRIYGHYA